jgi:hypothetical protein
MENKQTKVISTIGRLAGKQGLGKNLGKAIDNILTKTARVRNYGDELLYEDREPGFILDETRN